MSNQDKIALYEQRIELLTSIAAGKHMILSPLSLSLEDSFWRYKKKQQTVRIYSLRRYAHLLSFLAGGIGFCIWWFISPPEYLSHNLQIWLTTVLYFGLFVFISFVLSFTRWYFAKLDEHVLPFYSLIIATTIYFSQNYEPELVVLYESFMLSISFILVYALIGLKPLYTFISTVVGLGLALIASLIYPPVHFYVSLYVFLVVVSMVCWGLQFLTLASERLSFLQAEILALDHVRIRLLKDEMQRLSVEDHLTGLFNRRYFNESILIQCEYASNLQAPLSLLFVDVDYFKSYNDTYGHLEGDRVLLQIAQEIKACQLRAGDIAARFGGEEFVLLLPTTEMEGAWIVAKRLTERIQSLNLGHLASPYEVVTISVGIATINPALGMELRPNLLIYQADKALYSAKDAGRNCFVHYRDLEAQALEADY